MIDGQLHDGAHELGWNDDLGLEVGLLDALDARDVGQVLGTGDAHHLAIGPEHVVVDRGRGGDEVQAELALEALLDDLHVQEAEEAHAEAEAQGNGHLGRPSK